MKEFTIVYTAEITEVVVAEELADIDKEQLAAWIESKLKVDDVYVKDLKVFPREVEE